MEIKQFGNRQGKTIMLLHGNLMCWRQFENLIPLLEKKFCVYAVSFDGFDGTGETTYTTAQAQADKLAEYIEKELDGRLDLLYAESLGCGPAIILKASPNIQIGRMILSGPEYLDFGVLNRLILKVMPQKQYRTAHEKYMPAWALRFMGQTSRECRPCSAVSRIISAWNPSGPPGRQGFISIGRTFRYSPVQRSPAGTEKKKGI